MSRNSASKGYGIGVVNALTVTGIWACMFAWAPEPSIAFGVSLLFTVVITLGALALVDFIDGR